jgi:hypothetical protein
MNNANNTTKATPHGWGHPGNGKPPWTAAEKRELATAQLLNSEKPQHTARDEASRPWPVAQTLAGYRAPFQCRPETNSDSARNAARRKVEMRNHEFGALRYGLDVCVYCSKPKGDVGHAKYSRMVIDGHVCWKRDGIAVTNDKDVSREAFSAGYLGPDVPHDYDANCADCFLGFSHSLDYHNAQLESVDRLPVEPIPAGFRL